MTKELYTSILNERIAVYGTGNTARSNMELFENLDVIGFLDGKKTSGEFLGYKILSMDEAVKRGVTLILLAAQISSARIIYERITSICDKHNIKIYGIDCGDMREISGRITESRKLRMNRKRDLMRRIDAHDCISFSIIGTLVISNALYESDIYEITESKARSEGIFIDDFKMKRLCAKRNTELVNGNHRDEFREFKKISGCTDIECDRLMEIEKDVFLRLTLPRNDLIDCLNYALQKKKEVFLKYDGGFDRDHIAEILKKNGIASGVTIVMEREVDHGRYENCYAYMKDGREDKRWLHIGSSYEKDGFYASAAGMDAFIVVTQSEQLENSTLGEMLPYLQNINERSILGMVAAVLFNSPLEYADKKRPLIESAEILSYCYMAPLACAFTLFVYEKAREQKLDGILFGARDGYIFYKLYEKLSRSTFFDGVKDYKYFYTSRMAALTAGMFEEGDVEQARLWYGNDTIGRMFGTENEKDVIEMSSSFRKGYKHYLDNIRIDCSKHYGFVDLDSCGSTQYYLEKLGLNLTGLYCHQYIGSVRRPPHIIAMTSEAEIDANKNLLQEAVYSAVEPMLEHFDENGDPVFYSDSRSDKSICMIKENLSNTMQFWEFYLDNMYVPDIEISNVLPNRIVDLCNRKDTIMDDELFDDVYIDDR